MNHMIADTQRVWQLLDTNGAAATTHVDMHEDRTDDSVALLQYNDDVEINAAEDPAVRASCVEFILAGMYAMDQISRSQEHGQTSYET